MTHQAVWRLLGIKLVILFSKGKIISPITRRYHPRRQPGTLLMALSRAYWLSQGLFELLSTNLARIPVMKFLLAAIILLNVLNLSAQKPRFNFSQGLAGSLSYANQLYGDGDGGVKAEFGYLTQLSVGRRLRGRIGIGGSVIINSSKNNYQNTLNRTSRFAFNRDTSFSLRAGSVQQQKRAVIKSYDLITAQKTDF